MILPDGERVVYRRSIQDVLTRTNPKEECKRHVLLVLNAFDVDLSAQLLDALSDTLAKLEKPRGEFAVGPAWIDPYSFPLVTDNDEAAVAWLTEKK